MTWIIIIEWLARLILLFLAGLSVWSISLIIERRRFFKGLLSEKSGLYSELSALSKKWQRDSSFIHAYESARINFRKELDKSLGILGTLGSTTPFVGLLGTILGIIAAFGQLSSGLTDMKGIMFALAEALVLTAAGLVVAIPAVVAFNLFNKQIKLYLGECDAKKEILLAERGEQR